MPLAWLLCLIFSLQWVLSFCAENEKKLRKKETATVIQVLIQF
jgi:hypothetical protein